MVSFRKAILVSIYAGLLEILRLCQWDGIKFCKEQTGGPVLFQ
jgi:hypothetical protein